MKRAALERKFKVRNAKVLRNLGFSSTKCRSRKRHALDCGNTACQLCHSDKYPKRTPTRQEQLNSLKVLLKKLRGNL